MRGCTARRRAHLVARIVCAVVERPQLRQHGYQASRCFHQIVDLRATGGIVGRHGRPARGLCACSWRPRGGTRQPLCRAARACVRHREQQPTCSSESSSNSGLKESEPSSVSSSAGALGAACFSAPAASLLLAARNARFRTGVAKQSSFRMRAVLARNAAVLLRQRAERAGAKAPLPAPRMRLKGAAGAMLRAARADVNGVCMRW